MEKAAIGHVVLVVRDARDFSLYNQSKANFYRQGSISSPIEYATRDVHIAARIADQALLNAQEDSKNV